MTITQKSDLYTPEALLARVVNDRVVDAVTMLQTAAVEDVPDQEVWRDRVGETVTIRTFVTDSSGFAKDAVRDSRTGVTAEKLQMASYTELVENKTVSIDGDIFAMTDAGLEVVSDHLQDVVIESYARTIQRSLIGKAMQTDLLHDLTVGGGAGLVTIDSILDAKMAWGEHASGVAGAVLFLHSKQYRDLAKTEDFKALASAATPAVVEGGAAGSPIVATVHGIGIALLDSIVNTAGLPAIASITRVSDEATVETATPHGLAIGDVVEIAAADQVEYNGVKVVTGAPTPTTFTFAVSGNPATPATGEPVFVPHFTGLLCGPAALQLYRKLEPSVEMIPHAGSTVKTFDAHFRFATTLVRRRPRGVVRLRSR